MNTELKERIEKALNHPVMIEAVNNLSPKQLKFADMLCENIERKDDKSRIYLFYYKTAEDSERILKEMLNQNRLNYYSKIKKQY